MYDETTVIIPLPLTTEDYFIVTQLARRKNMTRSQFILDCVRQILLREQEAWLREQKKVEAERKDTPKGVEGVEELR